MKEEIWKDIEGYEGLYQVSNFGEIKSISRIFYEKSGRRKTVKGRILKLTKNYRGYLIIVLKNKTNLRYA